MKKKYCVITAVFVFFCFASPVWAANLNEPAVDFKLSGLDGNIHRLADYKGKWVIVNFWATWCGPCIREIPELNQFYHKHRDQGIEILGVNYEELTPTQIKLALNEFKIDYKVLYLGEDPEMSEAMVLKGLPTTFVISPDARLVKTWTGPVTEIELQEYLLPRIQSGSRSLAGYMERL